MDPQACFETYLFAIAEGDYDQARESQEAYSGWMGKSGFPAEARDGFHVTVLDLEQDRYGVVAPGAPTRTPSNGPAVEKWRKVQDHDMGKGDLVR